MWVCEGVWEELGVCVGICVPTMNPCLGCEVGECSPSL